MVIVLNAALSTDTVLSLIFCHLIFWFVVGCLVGFEMHHIMYSVGCESEILVTLMFII